MDRKWDSKPGSVGAASAQNEAIDRRERRRRLALETIDLAKDPYFMRNHISEAMSVNFACPCTTMRVTTWPGRVKSYPVTARGSLERRRAMEGRVGGQSGGRRVRERAIIQDLFINLCI